MNAKWKYLLSLNVVYVQFWDALCSPCTVFLRHPSWKLSHIYWHSSVAQNHCLLHSSTGERSQFLISLYFGNFEDKLSRTVVSCL